MSSSSATRLDLLEEPDVQNSEKFEQDWTRKYLKQTQSSTSVSKVEVWTGMDQYGPVWTGGVREELVGPFWIKDWLRIKTLNSESGSVKSLHLS